MRLCEVKDHNNTAKAASELYGLLEKKINDDWGITLDGFLVHLEQVEFISRFGTIVQKSLGGYVVAKIKDNKIIPLTEDERKFFKEKGLLEEKILDDLSVKDYDLLAQNFDMSSIPEDITCKQSRFIGKLLDDYSEDT